MGYAENAKNVEVLKDTVKTLAAIFSFSRTDPKKEGIRNVRFINSKLAATNLRPVKKAIDGLFEKVEFNGLTRIGTALKEKILAKYQAEKTGKPLIVIIVTDGEVCDGFVIV